MFCTKLRLRSSILSPTVTLNYEQRQTGFDTGHLQRAHGRHAQLITGQNAQSTSILARQLREALGVSAAKIQVEKYHRTTTSYSSATTGLLIVGELRSPENRGPADDDLL